jgi:lambda repressor-like predicted transcriptional regulator
MRNLITSFLFDIIVNPFVIYFDVATKSYCNVATPRLYYLYRLTTSDNKKQRGSKMECKLDEILKEKEMTRSALSKICGVAVTAKVCEGANIGLENGQKIAGALGLAVDDIWPNPYSVETVTETVEVTKTLLVSSIPENTESESIFS